jgi:hypothetical protein
MAPRVQRPALVAHKEIRSHKRPESVQGVNLSLKNCSQRQILQVTRQPDKKGMAFPEHLQFLQKI